MVIVEGPDRVGKTTFAKQLATELQYQYHHYGLLPESFQSPNDYIYDMQRDKVFDRFHISELVYSKIRNEPCKIAESHMKKIHEASNFTLVVITCEDCYLEDRLSKIKDSLYDTKQVMRANQMFISYSARIDGWGRWAIPKKRYWIHCDRRKPWPTLKDLQNVINLELRGI